MVDPPEVTIVVEEVVVVVKQSVTTSEITAAMRPVRKPGGAPRRRPRPPTVGPRDHRSGKRPFRGENYVHQSGPGLCSNSNTHITAKNH